MGRVADAQKRIADNKWHVPESQPMRTARPEAVDLSDEPFPEEAPATSAPRVMQAPTAGEPERPRPMPVDARPAPVARPAWSETRPTARDLSHRSARSTDARAMFDSIDEALRQEPPFRRRP